MDIFELQHEESYNEICGEIFLTNQRFLTIRCTLCEEDFKIFNLYVKHLSLQHYQEFDCKGVVDSKEEDTSNCFINVYSKENNDNLEPLESQKELFSMTNDALQEEEILIEFLKEGDGLKERNEGDSLPNKRTKSGTNKKVELRIPEVIRNVKKRTLITSETTPDEARKHKCPICNLAFKDRNNMRQHFRRHSNEKNHKCPNCEKTFFTPTEVKIHLKTHTRERNYLCSDCGKSYKRNFQLKCHIKRHKNQRDFKCEICDKAFFDNKVLKDHMVVHNSARPFVCTICSDTFPRALALKNHMKLHENRRAYKCKLCKGAFNQQAGLVSHMKLSHKDLSIEM